MTGLYRNTCRCDSTYGNCIRPVKHEYLVRYIRMTENFSRQLISIRQCEMLSFKVFGIQNNFSFLVQNYVVLFSYQIIGFEWKRYLEAEFIGSSIQLEYISIKIGVKQIGVYHCLADYLYSWQINFCRSNIGIIMPKCNS